MSRSTTLGLLSLLIAGAVAVACDSSGPPADAPAPAAAASTGSMPAPAGADWLDYGADKASTKYSSLTQINRANVDRLEIAWRFRSPENDVDMVNESGIRWMYQSTPLALDGRLYATSSLAQVSALDGVTGEPVWTFDPRVVGRNVASHGILTNRGLAFWRSGDERRLILGTPDARLIALDPETGEPIDSFGDGGEIDLTQGLRRSFDPNHYSVSSPPVIVGDVIVAGASITDAAPVRKRPPGDVRGFDVRTGEQLWVFESIPQPGQYGHETWEDRSWEDTGNTNVWTHMSADEELGYVYLPFSTPTDDWYGGNRPGDNLFAESLVCLDARTGERVWHFQTVHHGLWDYDLGSAPNLVDIVVDGRPVRAVAQVSKQGWVYVFDRVTGEPVWPIEERPVPPSTVPGERAAPTQPFPTRPAPFERQGVTVDDLIDFTPELRARAVDALSDFDMGPIFTPPTERGLAYLPGALGGANWQGAAFHRDSGTLYVPSITRPIITKIIAAPAAESDVGYWWEHVAPDPADWPPDLPFVKPPYGRITAIDLNSGEHLWVSPLGEGPRDHPELAGLDLPRLGWPLRGAPLLTEELLLIGQEGTTFQHLPVLVGALEGSAEIPDDVARDLGHFDSRFFAYDRDNGELVWEMVMPANIHGAPMTYMARGRQYIVVAVGGVTVPAELVAFTVR